MTKRAYSPVPFVDVRILGPFWRERLETVFARTIPSQHDKLEEVGILESLKLPKPVPPLTIPRNAHGFTMQVFFAARPARLLCRGGGQSGRSGSKPDAAARRCRLSDAATCSAASRQ